MAAADGGAFDSKEVRARLCPDLLYLDDGRTLCVPDIIDY